MYQWVGSSDSGRVILVSMILKLHRGVGGMLGAVPPIKFRNWEAEGSYADLWIPTEGEAMR